MPEYLQWYYISSDMEEEIKLKRFKIIHYDIRVYVVPKIMESSILYMCANFFGRVVNLQLVIAKFIYCWELSTYIISNQQERS